MTTLPPELIDAVLFYLRPPRLFDNTEGTLYEQYQDSKSDLLACSLVCHVWRSLSLMHLFHDVRVSYRSADATPMSGTSRSRSVERAGYAKALASFHSFLSHSPHIRECIRKLRLVFSPSRRGEAAGYHSNRHGSEWCIAQYPSENFLRKLLDCRLLPHLTHLDMCDVYLSPRSLDDDTPDHVDRIRSLTELRITCRIIHSVSLPDVSNLLSLFGVVERLHLCGFPAIHPGYDRYRYDKSTIRGLEPKCIIVNDPACYGPLLLKLCTSPAISYVDSFVVSVGASQPNWDEVAHLVEAAGEGLKHLTCVHMLQCITCDDIGIGHCPNLETITFQFFVHDDQWFFPNYKRWECIFRFLSSLAATYRNWPNLHTIIFSISTRDILLHYRPSTRDQPWLRAVEGVILQLAHSRLLSPRMIRDQEYLRDRWGNTAKLQLKIVPHCKIGHPISRFEECEGQAFFRAFPMLYEEGVVSL